MDSTLATPIPMLSVFCWMTEADSLLNVTFGLDQGVAIGHDWPCDVPLPLL
jgi:ethanolamine transporter EutH